jgi:hypothetical protein
VYKLFDHHDGSNTVNLKYADDLDADCPAQYMDKEKKLKVGDIIYGKYESGENWGFWFFFKDKDGLQRI